MLLLKWTIGKKEEIQWKNNINNKVVKNKLEMSSTIENSIHKKKIK